MRELTQFEIEMVSGGADGDSFPEIVVTANQLPAISGAEAFAILGIAGLAIIATGGIAGGIALGLAAADVGVVGYTVGAFAGAATAAGTAVAAAVTAGAVTVDGQNVRQP